MTTERYSDSRDIKAEISGQVVNISGQPVEVYTGAVNVSGETVVIASGPFVRAMVSGDMLRIASGTGPILIETSGKVIKISGETVVAKVSGEVAKVSGETVIAKTSGQVIKVSGETIIAKISGDTIITTEKQPTVIKAYITRPVSDLSGGICIVSGGASIAVRAAMIKSFSGYTDIYVGGSGTPVSSSGTPLSSYGMLVCEGEALTLDIDNLNAIYAAASVSGNPLSVIGISY